MKAKTILVIVQKFNSTSSKGVWNLYFNKPLY